MAKATVPAVLIDLDATSVRIALRCAADSDSGLKSLPSPDIATFDLVSVIAWALAEWELTGALVDVFVSVPAPVVGDRVDIRVPAHWRFSRKAVSAALGKRFKIRRFEVVNDMYACGLALPGILAGGGFDTLGGGGAAAPIDGYPVLLVCARPYPGACGLAPVLYDDPSSAESGPVWIPVLAVPGEMPLVPLDVGKKSALGTELTALLHTIAPQVSAGIGFPTALSYLSPEGIERMYRTVTGEAGPGGVSIQGFASAPASDAAAKTMEMWCFMFGLWVRSLALAYGARGGVYVSGVTPLAFFEGERAERNRALFRESFEIGGPPGGYLKNMPTYLLRHEEPFLAGLEQLAQSFD